MTKRGLFFLLILNVVSFFGFGQASQDFFYGRTDVATPKIHPHRIAVSCSAAGLTWTCTPTSFTSAAQTYQDANITNWTVTASGVTFNVAGCGNPGFANCSTTGYESFAIDGTGTAMDWVPCTTNATQCALHLTSLNTSTGAFTLISTATQTVSATNGFLRPAYVSVQSGINTPFSSSTTGFADPLGNWFYEISVTTLCTACSNSNDTRTSLGETQNQILVAKYGSTCNAAQFETADMVAAFVNTSGSDGDASYSGNATGGCGAQFKTLMQYNGLTLQQPDGFDLMDNRFGFAAQPPLDLNSLLDRTIPIGEVHQNIGYFSPYWTNYITGYWTTASGDGSFTNKSKQYASPMFLGDQTSDTDFVNFNDPNQWWPDVEFSQPGVDPGWIVAISPLHGSFEQKNSSQIYTPHHMPDDLNYDKQLSASAPAGCYLPFSYTSPSGGSFGTSFAACSWGDTVRNYFNNSVSAMNTAFGGTTFSSFGTSETAVASESVCAAGSCTSSINYTLAHTNPTPGSLHILITVSGTTVDVSGDCWFSVPTCGIAASDGSKATFAGETSAQGMIVNSKAWQANRDIPAGWCLVDSNSNYQCAQGAGKTGGSAPTWSTTLNGTTTDNTITWKEWGPIVTHGSGSIINYSGGSAGNLLLAMNATPGATEAISVSYTFSGWGAGGTGLLDDDGASAAGSVGGTDVFGTNPVATVAPANWASSTAYGPFTNDCEGPPVDVGKACGVINTTATGFWAIQTNPNGCTSGGSQPSWAGPMGTEFDEGTGPCRWIVYTCVAGATGCHWTNVINANATAGFLMHLYVYERSLSYVSVILPLHRKLWPDWLYMFPNSFTTTLRSSWLQVLQQQGQNVATMQGGTFVLCGNSCGNGVFNPMDIYELAAFQSVFKGVYNIESFICTKQVEQTDVCPQPSFSNSYTTLAAAATGYFTAMSNALNIAKNNPTLFSSLNIGGRGLGVALHDIQNNSWQQYKSYRDNRHDGIEDVGTANVTCGNGAGNSCGGEAGTNGTNWASPWGYNAWGGSTGLIKANQLWLLTPSSSGAPCALCMAGRAQNVSGEMAVK